MTHTPHITPPSGFYGIGIAPSLLEILGKMKLTTPTPIQAQAIPIAIQGKDVVGIAQTGTGKTLAFGVPMIQRLAQIQKQGLIVAPTRELALQIEEVLRLVGARAGLRTAVLIGGAAMGSQIHALARKPHVIVATPGRLIDHLEQGRLRLNNVGVVVLDEADHMLDMGFLPQIKRIFAVIPNERQTMLFSATMPPAIMKLAATYMELPVRVEIAPAGTTAEGVKQELFIVSSDRKLALLKKLLDTYQGSTLVFTRTKHGAKKVTRQMRALGIAAAEIHSNRSLGQRREALQGFKSGKYRVLIATDIAARGIDVVGIELVVNYDLPSASDDYVHRIGRTARAGAVGHAITFAMPGQDQEVRAIERSIRKQLHISKMPELPTITLLPPMYEEPRHQRPRFGGHRGPSHRFGPPHRSARPKRSRYY